MKRWWLLVLLWACADANAQVRCKMPNGVWIEQKLAATCPAGTLQAQTMDGKPLALRLPEPQARPRLPPKVVAPVPLRSERQSMAFDACVRTLTQTVLAVGGANTRVIVSAPEMRMLRVCTNDGSVLVTCSRDDSTMVTTSSPNRCD